MRTRLAGGVLPLLLLGIAGAGSAAEIGGFSLEKLTVPADQVLEGGPGRDGIRSVDSPEFASPDAAKWVREDSQVLGVAIDGTARAYPVHVLERHQLVNDRFGDVPVLVSYDPIAGVPLAFNRSVDGRVLSFGVSGLIYNGNFLLYDRETESLWSQFSGRAIAGPLSGSRLERIRVRQETWAAWRARHPDTVVMTLPAPDKIDYRVSPFQTYWGSPRVPFPVLAADARFHPKEVVVGVVVGSVARAYLGSIVTAAGGTVDDQIGDVRIRLVYSSDDATFQFDVPEGVELTEAYWFAWKAFHPETEVWRDPGPAETP